MKMTLRLSAIALFSCTLVGACSSSNDPAVNSNDTLLKFNNSAHTAKRLNPPAPAWDQCSRIPLVIMQGS
jgi:hypothetical protein